MTTKPIPAAPPAPPQPQLLLPQYPAGIEPLPTPPRKPDAMLQYPHASRAYLILEDHFIHRPEVLVAGDGYLCRYADDRSGYVVPDCIVAFGVNSVAIRDQRNGYVISEVGKPPEFALEVASESTGKRDYTSKPGIYAGFGVAEYWRFDRTGGQLHDAPLAGDRLVDGAYTPIPLTTNADGVIWGRSDVLGLDLCWDSGRLRFYDPVAGEYLPDLTQWRVRARAAETQSETNRARADAAEAQSETNRARADAAEAQSETDRARADAAEAELRRLREQFGLS